MTLCVKNVSRNFLTDSETFFFHKSINFGPFPRVCPAYFFLPSRLSIVLNSAISNEKKNLQAKIFQFIWDYRNVHRSLYDKCVADIGNVDCEINTDNMKKQQPVVFFFFDWQHVRLRSSKMYHGIM